MTQIVLGLNSFEIIKLNHHIVESCLPALKLLDGLLLKPHLCLLVFLVRPDQSLHHLLPLSRCHYAAFLRKFSLGLRNCVLTKISCLIVIVLVF